MKPASKQVLVDSSAFLALYSSSDPEHPSMSATVKNLLDKNISLLTTNFIRSESYTLIGCRLSYAEARLWLKKIDIPVEYVTPGDEQNAIKLLQKYNDKTFSFVDATSFTVMTRLGISTALTLDTHFKQYGFTIL